MEVSRTIMRRSYTAAAASSANGYARGADGGANDSAFAMRRKMSPEKKPEIDI